MEKMDVAKDPAVKMKGEDLAYAYDAVRVANKSVCPWLVFYDVVPSVTNLVLSVHARFLESQLHNQRTQWEEELEALRCQLTQKICGSASSAQGQVEAFWL